MDGLCKSANKTFSLHFFRLNRTYPGNQAVVPNFNSLTASLIARYGEFSDGAEHVTLMFYKGNYSQDNLAAVGHSPYHFDGSQVPTQHPGSLKISSKCFLTLEEEGLPGVGCTASRESIRSTTSCIRIG